MASPPRPDRHRDAASEIDRDLADRALRRIGDLALDPCDNRELVDRVAHVVGDRGRERFLVAQPRAEVAADDDPPFALGHPLELLEQHGLADPPQARDPEVAALLRIILEQSREAAELLVTACEERRSSADARLVRVLRHSCGDRTDLHRDSQDPVNSCKPSKLPVSWSAHDRASGLRRRSNAMQSESRNMSYTPAVAGRSAAANCVHACTHDAPPAPTLPKRTYPVRTGAPGAAKSRRVRALFGTPEWYSTFTNLVGITL